MDIRSYNRDAWNKEVNDGDNRSTIPGLDKLDPAADRPSFDKLRTSLGSTVAVTDASGTLTSKQRYLPFGGARISSPGGTIPNSPILVTDFGYTGQRMLDDDMGGIMDYKARFYSPALGRFSGKHTPQQ